jgi:hypothetical protein
VICALCLLAQTRSPERAVTVLAGYASCAYHLYALPPTPFPEGYPRWVHELRQTERNRNR